MREIQTSLLPFHLDRKTVTVQEGKTLKEIVETLFPKKISGVRVKVLLDDKTVKEELWGELIPPTNSVVCVNAVPAGGKGKNPLAIILSIVVVVAAAYAAPIIGAALGLESAAAIGAIQAGLGAIGLLAVTMLASTFSQDSKNVSGDLAESSTQFIEGANNAVDRYGVVPINLGTNRMFPKQAALPYTETSSNLQYVRQLFTYGFGKHIITQRKLGDTLISDYNEVEYEDRLSGDLHEGTAIYSKDVFQVDYNVTLSNSAGYITRTTELNSNEVEFDITFATGLTKYNDSGKRGTASVEFEAQVSPAGAGTWSAGASGASFTSKELTIPPRVTIKQWNIRTRVYDISYVDNAHVVFLNYGNGAVTLATYTYGDTPPASPVGCIRIASIYVTTSANLTDERLPYIPSKIADSSSFTPSVVGMTLTIAAGTVSSNTFIISGATAEPLRISRRITFPTAGEYDLRIKRITADSVNTKVVDIAKLSAVKSIKNSAPVNLRGISGTAMRIRGTDQLTGTVSNYNAVCSTIITYYDPDTDSWVEGPSSDPASLYRYVLQCDAFLESKRLADSRIDLVKLKEWSIYCRERGLTYNRIIDYDANIDSVLDDICAAGMATKHKTNGSYSVIIDNERDTIKGLVTPRNSWNYKGNISYPEIPHAFRVQFRNKDKGYEVDEQIVYQDGYSILNTTDFERLEISSCTDSALAYYYGRRYLAAMKLQPETHTFSMDFENRSFNRGDRIQLINDVILVGVGQGRIKELVDDTVNVTGFVIDELVEIPSTKTFGVRIRHADGSDFVWYELDTEVGSTDTFTFTIPVPIASAPGIGSLCAFTEFGKELDLIVTSITSDKNHNAVITAINYAPERFNADTETIPAFNSKITQSIGNLKPIAPVLAETPVSDETVMNVNSDGSYTSRMVINLINKNESTVDVFVKYQRVGESNWSIPDILTKTPNKLILTGLQDGSYYNFQIFYQRSTGQMLLSSPLNLSKILFSGASGLPSDVADFKFSTSDSVGIFEWTPNTDIDVVYYRMRFTKLTTGVEWDNSQTLRDKIIGNTIALPIQSGTYLIKAVDVLGNESANASLIISYNDGALRNVVENLIQQPTWSGTKENCSVTSSELYLDDPELPGYYYFTPEPLDLSEIYESYLSSSLQAYGISVGAGGTPVRNFTSVRAVSSIRGIDRSSWSVTLEINTSDNGSDWSGWSEFKVGAYIFRYVKFRLVLLSTDPTVTGKVSTAEVKVDMPDRLEYQDDVSCPDTGVTITYSIPFKNNPSVNITLQDAETDDRIEYSSKTSSGFAFSVYNKTLDAYVARTFDYTSSGYGRVIT